MILELTKDRGDMAEMLLDDTLPSLLTQMSLPSASQQSLPPSAQLPPSTIPQSLPTIH